MDANVVVVEEVVMVDVELDKDEDVETEVDGDEVEGLSFSSISRVAFLKETQLKDARRWQPKYLGPENTLACPEAHVEVPPVQVELFFTQTVSKWLRYQSWVPASSCGCQQ